MCYFENSPIFLDLCYPEPPALNSLQYVFIVLSAAMEELPIAPICPRIKVHHPLTAYSHANATNKAQNVGLLEVFEASLQVLWML